MRFYSLMIQSHQLILKFQDKNYIDDKKLFNTNIYNKGLVGLLSNLKN